MPRIILATLMMLAQANALYAQGAPAAGEERVYVQAGRLLADPHSGKVERDKTIVIAAGVGQQMSDAELAAIVRTAGEVQRGLSRVLQASLSGAKRVGVNGLALGARVELECVAYLPRVTAE